MARPKSTTSPDVTDSQNVLATAAGGDRETHPHGVQLAMTFEDLLGDDETTDESASDIIQAVRAWRDVTSLRSLD
jgi:hypothetical protein